MNSVDETDVEALQQQKLAIEERIEQLQNSPEQFTENIKTLQFTNGSLFYKHCQAVLGEARNKALAVASLRGHTFAACQKYAKSVGVLLSFSQIRCNTHDVDAGLEDGLVLSQEEETSLLDTVS